MPQLEELYLNENRIKSLTGLDNLVKLKRLHLRNNNIEAFEETFPMLDSLEYLNLRENRISKFEEILKLKELPKLNSLIISFNPLISDMGNIYFLETLIAFPNLKRLNKFEITKQVLYQKYMYQQKLFEEEKAKKLAEEEAERKKLEQEEMENNNNLQGD